MELQHGGFDVIARTAPMEVPLLVDGGVARTTWKKLLQDLLRPSAAHFLQCSSILKAFWRVLLHFDRWVSASVGVENTLPWTREATAGEVELEPSGHHD